MSSEREEAKASVTTVTVKNLGAGDGTTDSHGAATLTQVMGAADQLKRELQNQQHLQAMKTKEVGWFGVIFGTESLASIVIAFCVILMSFFTAGAFEFAGYKSGKQEFWSHEAQQVFSIASAALGFIFGRTNRRPSK